MKNTLNTNLLQYYIYNGYNIITQSKVIMLSCAARGDITGMSFLLHRNIYSLSQHDDDSHDVCTVAGAAGQLDALMWLVEVAKFPWHPRDVFREASENVAGEEVMNYVERVAGDSFCGGQPYGVGMP
eukprot:CAMPEP_0172508806 /NCGR_PEP_ID=MMETSP1066-20121228/214989_1 /TAXON_ID=671091 /ORGANISM="Coscinodiscus wailesii, Strain CCMP2513" /LENGTH=126 /DNA_ID=CAMNT_0013286973 /DNA_START=240 /DNA_END=616 /DNA_ORIENTATION=+